MFLRLCLADGFIHGIGGAKYDEVTDAIIERWLGLKPPGFIVVTATVRLPLPTFPTTQADFEAAQRNRRDIHWNPQRHVSAEALTNQDLQHALAVKAKLIQSEPKDKRLRKSWFEDLGDATDAIRNFVVRETNASEADLAQRRREMTANEALIRRDFSWCLFPEESLKRFCQRLL